MDKGGACIRSVQRCSSAFKTEVVHDKPDLTCFGPPLPLSYLVQKYSVSALCVKAFHVQPWLVSSKVVLVPGWFHAFMGHFSGLNKPSQYTDFCPCTEQRHPDVSERENVLSLVLH